MHAQTVSLRLPSAQSLLVASCYECIVIANLRTVAVIFDIIGDCFLQPKINGRSNQHSRSPAKDAP